MNLFVVASYLLEGCLEYLIVKQGIVRYNSRQAQTIRSPILNY